MRLILGKGDDAGAGKLEFPGMSHPGLHTRTRRTPAVTGCAVATAAGTEGLRTLSREYRSYIRMDMSKNMTHKTASTQVPAISDNHK